MVPSWRCPNCIVVLVVEGCGVGRWFHHGDALIALRFLLQRECGGG